MESEDEMTTLLKDQPELIKAYEQYQVFNHDERLRALDEAHQRFLHDLATDIEEAHEKGREEGREKMIETLLRFLTRNFGNVPPTVRDKLLSIHDLEVLGQLTETAWDCQSLAEFEAALRK